jgi:hypothetical protein
MIYEKLLDLKSGAFGRGTVLAAALRFWGRLGLLDYQEYFPWIKTADA